MHIKGAPFELNFANDPTFEKSGDGKYKTKWSGKIYTVISERKELCIQNVKQAGN